jgi:hypothetical protein
MRRVLSSCKLAVLREARKLGSFCCRRFHVAAHPIRTFASSFFQAQLCLILFHVVHFLPLQRAYWPLVLPAFSSGCCDYGTAISDFSGSVVFASHVERRQAGQPGFAATTKKEFGIEGVEYVNQFFKDKAKDKAYLAEMNKRASDTGVTQLLIMVDGEGQLGDANSDKRTQAVENHYQWVEAAKELGCHSIRVNAGSSGSYDEQLDRAADGLRALTEFGDKHDINVIVENHGGLSSNGAWLSAVIKKVDHKRCGTLPDFGNFAIDRGRNEWYDRYQGTRELMPYAKAVSAKTHDFDESRPLFTIDTRTGKETDYQKICRSSQTRVTKAGSESNTKAASWMNLPASRPAKLCWNEPWQRSKSDAGESPSMRAAVRDFRMNPEPCTHDSGHTLTADNDCRWPGTRVPG